MIYWALAVMYSLVPAVLFADLTDAAVMAQRWDYACRPLLVVEEDISRQERLTRRRDAHAAIMMIEDRRYLIMLFPDDIVMSITCARQGW